MAPNWVHEATEGRGDNVSEDFGSQSLSRLVIAHNIAIGEVNLAHHPIAESVD
jgi:hypothetical protein